MSCPRVTQPGCREKEERESEREERERERAQTWGSAFTRDQGWNVKGFVGSLFIG